VVCQFENLEELNLCTIEMEMTQVANETSVLGISCAKRMKKGFVKRVFVSYRCRIVICVGCIGIWLIGSSWISGLFTTPERIISIIGYPGFHTFSVPEENQDSYSEK